VPKVFFAWCMCGDSIAESGPDPCNLIVTTRDGRDQMWHCHAACFKEKRVSWPPIFEPE